MALQAANRRARLLLQALESRSLPATFTVTTTADNFDPGTLRQSLISANNTPEADTIIFNTNAAIGTDFSLPQTITMGLGNFTITRPLTIVGPGADKLTINANNGRRILYITDVTTAVIDVTISGITMTNGRVTSGDGGGIAIANENVTILDSVIAGNSVTGNTGSSGGGISVGANGALTVRNTTISGNSASGQGGGIYFYRNGSLLFENSTLSGNTQTAPDFGGGGGIAFFGVVQAGGLTIRNSTISGNSARSGGGLFISNFTGAAQIQNSTITSNTATTTDTGAGTVGGGICKFFGAGTIALTSSIVAGNFAPNTTASKRADISLDGAGLMLATNNAIGIDPGIGAFAAGSGFNLPFGAALNLQPLANNGGPTRTHALGAGSAAIDKGANPANLTTDQRGPGFPRVAGLPDIGAVEAGTANAPVASLNPTMIVTAIGGTTYSFQITYTDVAGINVGSLDGNDVRVTGPGFNSLAAFGGVTPGGNGTPRTATYTIVPPGGSWDAADAGSYTVAIEPGQVLSTGGPPVSAGSIGAFLIATPTTFTVLNANDAGPGSLRQAILDSNARAGSADTIVFDSTFFATSRTVNLAGQLVIEGSVTIDGPGLNLLTVRRDPAAVAQFRVFEVSESGLHDVTLAGMTISGGNPTGPSGGFSTGQGGGIFSSFENLTVLNAAITGNSAVEGGAIATTPGGGSLTVRNSTISGNTANGILGTYFGGGGGGGIYIPYGGQLLVENSTISGNVSTNGHGGGIYVYGYVASDSAWTIRNSTLSGNTARNGGGIYSAAYDGDSLLLENSTLSGNTSTGAGGGIFLYGAGSSALTVRNTTLSGNMAARGGGIYFIYGASLLVQNSTLSGNTATAGRGGGIYFYGTGSSLTVQNSTLSANTASDRGGGIFTSTTGLLVQNCTITNNQANSAAGGGGIYQSAGAAGIMTVVSSIVSGNINANGPDIRAFGTVNVNFSAVGSATGFALSGTSADNRPFGAMLNLQPLTNNGGPTQTHALGAGSAAIDTGSNPLNLTTDQRGPGFVRANGQTDIGAFEVQGATPPPRISGTQVNNGTAQRSRVTSLTITFDAQVDFAGGNVGNAFMLTRNGGGAVSFTATANVVGGVTVVTLDNFMGAEAQSGSLRDGRYTLTALAANISNAGGQLDGDGNGTGGDNYTFGDTQGLFRYFGDMNGDRRVDISDFGFFSLAYLTPANYNPALDFNADGRIDIADFGQFSVRYFTSLP